MKIDPDSADPKLLYSTMIRVINPRPIAWVSTVSPQGIPNLAPFSYFNGVGSRPPTLMFSVVNHPDGRKKDTTLNIEANSQFVVNIGSFRHAREIQLTAEPFEYGVNEFEQSGVKQLPSDKIAPPRVAECAVQIECELFQQVNVGEGPLAANLFIGKIVLMHIDEQVLDGSGKVDPNLLDTIGRMGGREYCRTQDRFIPS